jgi:Phosphate-selective porin O and P
VVVTGASHKSAKPDSMNVRTLLVCVGLAAATSAHAQPAPDPNAPAPTVAPAEPVPPPTPTPPVQPVLVPATEPPPVAVIEPKVADQPAEKKDDKKDEPKWYDKISLRGYTQLRYNRLPSLDVNDDLINTQGDRSIGKNGGFFIRRARLILFGDVHKHLAIYLQPDMASSAGTQAGVAILRDWYADVFFDEHKEFRVRVGQSKVPYGFENLQSSQNRLPLDRNDALNSAVRDERDLGAFFYWTPPKYRKLFKRLVDDNLKGSGDYGIVGFGAYNGQTANQPSDEGAPHVIGRVSVPIELGKQIIEVGGGGYYGKYTVSLTQPTTGRRFAVEGATSETPNPALRDTRAFGTFILYPQPLGFAAEYTAGYGPQQGANTPTRIASAFLHGGYAQLFYQLGKVGGMRSLIPFVRGTYYKGGKKFFANAPRYEVKELELGVEAQIFKALELVVAYDIVRRTSDPVAPAFTPVDDPGVYGHVTRVQLQFNY